MAEITTTRRRSQRLFLRVPVVVQVSDPNRPPLLEETHTIVLNAHGTLLEMGAALETGQTVTLKNLKTSERIECTVKLVTPADVGKFNIALEFKKPNASFWQISFPPEDWAPHDKDPQKRL
ncbi:MAG TPA: hypothetical protein VHS29_08130 [Candidatus Acidoferrales bacterium]|nr:hypothetical protein [Candidatus Acidoferrales bacterium]